MSRPIRVLCAAVTAVALPHAVMAQSSTPIPEISSQGQSAVTGGSGSGANPSLTVLNTAAARAAIDQTPGAVELVPDTVWKTTRAATLKDMLDYVPGVFVQPKWGEDSRLSIRGSGLSRNFHLRGVQLYMDGVPLNTADGYGDFQEIDPTAYRYVEVWKGANGLRYGVNSLGGAINFVTPSGYDARAYDGRVDLGAWGFGRVQGSSGGVSGPFDYYINASGQRAEGYREHSWGEGERLNANFGYRVSPNFETRLYVNANHVLQRIPGEVTKDWALINPQAAWPNNVANDWQRNIDTLRVISRSTLRLDNTVIEFGGFGIDRHLMHPIFQWLDYRYEDYGAFVRAVDERSLWGFRNRLTTGFNMVNGTTDARQYANVGGQQGMLMSNLTQRPQNYNAYIENAFYALPSVSLVAGTQFLYAVREQQVNFSLNGDVNGRSRFNVWSPKIGMLWDVDPSWQVFGNISRSAEVPSFGESVAPNFLNPAFPTIPFFDIKAQTATTYEIGTRGRRPDYTWDFALYRANISNELLCFYNSFGTCNVTNADKTYHQGVEAGLGVTLLKGLAIHTGEPDRVWLNLAYTYNDFHFRNDPVFGNNYLPGAPPHYMRAELMYKLPNGYSFGPNIEWVPQAYYVDSANTLLTASYLLWGLRGVYDTGSGFSAYIEGRNLSDKYYISSVSIIDRANSMSRLFNPGNGMGVFAGVRWRT
ncbi:MAG TPA: TonB-dependent receptor [Xanthobacteraceae bacterium]|nr:TonB-dependent receptor [Xanthobacteraceae bacterium]